MISKIIYLIIVSTIIISCMHITDEQSEVNLAGFDLKETLRIALVELEEGEFGSSLTIWALRDQIIDAEGGREIANIYFAHIEQLDNDFDRWHFSWAIANLYRNNGPQVKESLQDAYDFAKEYVTTLEEFGEVADLHVNGEKVMMGDVHFLGRAYATSHLVVRGNDKYVQSYEDFVKKRFWNEKDKIDYYLGK